jgi:pimeloyl-ACP methyl ester carboxylesterase
LYLGIHGWSGTHHTFNPLIPFLPADATLIVVDLPGCGQSPSLPEINKTSIAGAIAGEIEKLPFGPITLIGNCSGGILGLTAMPLLAERIERLILIDPFAYAPWYFKIFVQPVVGKLAYYSTFANPIGRWTANASLRKHRAEKSHLTESFQKIDHDAALRYLQMMIDIRGIDEFGWIRLPIDILYGERTFGAVRASAAMWKRIWPQARLHELKGAGHLPIQEATVTVSRILFSL